MAHHAYVYAGGIEAGITSAREFAERELGLPDGSPDISVFSYQHFSVEDARSLGAFAAQAPTQGDQKVIVLTAGRLFHEAQNALLKLFEEPPHGTTLILVVPAEGMLLPTLRSRVLSLPGNQVSIGLEEANEFLSADAPGRAKQVAKLVLNAKSDKDEEKQAARLRAIRLVEGLIRYTHEARKNTKDSQAHELDLLLRDLSRFLPILHERSAPLKLIFEHLLLVVPEELGK